MTPLTDTARAIFQQALADCDVEATMARHISAENGLLQIGNETFKLESLRAIRIVAVGKAANGMLRGLWRQFPSLAHCNVAGVLISPERPSWLSDQFQFLAGGHPVPNAASFAGARAALDLVGQLRGSSPAEALCIFLISGGASAMMELPLDPKISLADMIEFHRALVASGASIAEINCVRKHFSAVKGGRLALAAGSGTARHTFLVSDVPVEREDTLGSGPTLPDSSDSDECRRILDRFGLLPQFPARVRQFFEPGSLLETPKPNELQASFQVILSSRDLAEAAAQIARTLRFYTVIDNTCDEWEYREAAKYLLNRLRTLRPDHPRICLISAGEVAVALPAQGSSVIGTGGRNLQFALYTATLLGREDRSIAILSAGSDGIDGNSPAAGAVVNEHIFDNSNCNRTAAVATLANFDAYPLMKACGGAIETGPTGNNLRDLRLLLAEG
jgi:glycerate 2-kinase